MEIGVSRLLIRRIRRSASSPVLVARASCQVACLVSGRPQAGGKLGVMRRSGGIRVIVAAAGMLTVVSAALAAPAVAAPAAAAPVSRQVLYTFGYNPAGELGDGTRARAGSAGPGQRPAGDRPSAIGRRLDQRRPAVRRHGLDLGRQHLRRAGHPATSGGTAVTPQPVAGLSGITQIAVGTGTDDRDVYAVRSRRHLVGLGRQRRRRARQRDHPVSRFSPVQVPGLTGITQVSAGPDYALALRSGRHGAGLGRQRWRLPGRRDHDQPPDPGTGARPDRHRLGRGAAAPASP